MYIQGSTHVEFDRASLNSIAAATEERICILNEEAVNLDLNSVTYYGLDTITGSWGAHSGAEGCERYRGITLGGVRCYS